jgi:hypothetical protein
VIILATFLKNLFPNPQWPVLVSFALFSFLMALLFSVYVMWRFPLYMETVALKAQKELLENPRRYLSSFSNLLQEEPAPTKKGNEAEEILAAAIEVSKPPPNISVSNLGVVAAHRISLAAFFLGIATFALFATINLYG